MYMEHVHCVDATANQTLQVLAARNQTLSRSWLNMANTVEHNYASLLLGTSYSSEDTITFGAAKE